MKYLRSAATALVVLVVLGSQQVAAFTQNDFFCANQGDFGGTCFYEKGCSSQSGDASTVSPGSGAPDGAQFPNLDPASMANSIEAFVKKTAPGSPLNGLGTTIVASSKKADINPFLVVAIANQETSLGTASTAQVTTAHNLFNRKATSSQPNVPIGGDTWYKWSSVKASVDNTAPENQNATGGGDFPAYLRNQYGSSINSGDFGTLFALYDPGYSAYSGNVKGWMTDMINGAQGAGGSPTSSTGTPSTTAPGGTTPSGTSGPTIVLDPGHAPGTDETVDPATHEPVFDYENDPEMQQVWQVAQSVKAQLESDGYNVLLTKNSLNDSSTNLKKRADVGNQANAALGVSLHTNPGASQVYYPGVGDYLVKTTGQHDVYTDQKLADTDKQDATTMAQDLHQVEQQPWEAGTYDSLIGPITRHQGSLTMQGTMLVTQYFAKVPWVYVEQAQTSTGSIDSSTSSDYVKGVVKGVEDIVPLAASSGNSSGSCCPSGGGGGGGVAVSGSVSLQAGHGMSASAQQKFQQYAVAAGQRNNVDPNLIATFYYTEMGRTGDSTNNADAAQPPPVTGDGKWIEPAPPVGTGGAYVTNSLGYSEPMGLNDLDKNAYGEDGDGDGKIVMTDLADAMFTSAKYIKDHGGTGDNPSPDKVKAVGVAYNGDQYAASVVNTYNYLKKAASGSVSGSVGSAVSCSDVNNSVPGTIEAAVQAAQQLSDCKLPYVWGGLHQAGSLAVTDCSQLKSKYGGADCSGSTSWVLHQAGMFPGNAGIVSGDFGSWGQAGQGSSMTVWENDTHVFIEFNVPGLGHYEMNTVNDIGGPRFLKWGDSGSMTSTAGFTPRHWPGT